MHQANSRHRWMPAFAGMTRGVCAPKCQHGTWSYCVSKFVVRWAVLGCAVLLVGCGAESPAPSGRTKAAPRSGPDAASVRDAGPSHSADTARRLTFAGPSSVESRDSRDDRNAVDARPLPVFRPSDNRPKHDDDRLARMGIRRYESRRLILYTDIAAEHARILPPLIDKAYDSWVDYFGELPPDRARSEWQITGYVIGDRERFRRAGLVPGDLPPFINGRHRGREFWMFDQKDDYYRRHLLTHEATHCFMTTMPKVALPLWYHEGMAELFGTHLTEEDGRVRFRVMPHDNQSFAGHARIELLRRDFARNGHRRLADLETLRPNDFIENEAYAWSWALCHFFDAHPAHSAAFRDIGRKLGTQPFGDLFRRAFGTKSPEIASDWAVFAGNLMEGYDLERAAIVFGPGQPLDRDRQAECAVRADRGWQSSGVRVEAGKSYEIAATGRFTLAREPRSWVSEPAGITFRYFDGRPLGELLATVRAEIDRHGRGADSMLSVVPIGARGTFTPSVAGTLYFRLNDSWAELADNEGKARVVIREVSDR